MRIDVTNMEYKEIALTYRAVHSIFYAALAIEYGVSGAGSHCYRDTKHSNPVLEHLKQENFRWNDALHRKRLDNMNQSE